MRVLSFTISLLLVWLCAPGASAAGLSLERPVDGVVLRGFDEVGRYSAGHRGVDLAAPAGTPVHAAAVGTVSFVGRVAGVASVSIDHGNGWRTTYLPVRASVRVGQQVSAGEVIGTVTAGHCAQRSCLHWGLTDGTDYADPLAFTQNALVRLVPAGTQPTPPPTIGAASAVVVVGGLPVAGRTTSRFGMRRHPVTGVWKLHDGTDLAAPCGTPIRAPTGGRITRAYFNAAYGWRVFIDHGGGLVTAYNHLPGLEVQVGQTVAPGQRIGSVGTTGLSTGCHLHWMAWRSGRLLDPLTLVA